jgi:hypothetical protein
MGFYIKKRLSVGPFRFNLSKSGVGISVGIPGLTIGSGPRGNYVHIGAAGVYYKSTISKPKTPRSNIHISNEYHQSGVEEVKILQDSDVSTIVDSSSEELINEIKRKHKRIIFWPYLLIAGSVGVIKIFTLNIPSWLTYILSFLCAVIVGISYFHNQIKKNVVLFYDFDSRMQASYESLCQSISRLSRSKKLWYTETSADVMQPKYHAGASTLVDRKSAGIRFVKPPFIKTNIEIISIAFGHQILYFFPDRILIYQGKNVGAISYTELDVHICTSKFIETDNVPRDAKIIDKTWQYVNKSGDPDRRFKNNKALPVCRYEEISFLSDFGLHKKLILSFVGNGEFVKNAVSDLANKLPTECNARNILEDFK